MKRILVIRDRFKHMGAYSGYDQLFNFLEKESGSPFELLFVRREEKFSNKVERKIYFELFNRASGTAYYTLSSFKAEISALVKGYRRKADLIHISFLENSYGLTKAYKKLPGTKVIATAHQPASWWRLGNTKPSIVEGLDGLIVLDSASKLFFSSFIDSNKIYVVKHGVDTNFFAPLPGREKNNRSDFKCLFAGIWLRDMQLLAQVVNYINSRSSLQISFHLIYPHENKLHDWNLYKLAVNNNVFWYSDLSDGQLLKMYQNSDLFLIPLIDCTANNAILEAMACGLPIVSTVVSGISDYVNNDFAFLNNDPAVLGNHIIESFQNFEVLMERSKKAREHAIENLRWEEVAKQTKSVYSNVISEN